MNAEWTSCSEKMPPFNTRVLCTIYRKGKPYIAVVPYLDGYWGDRMEGNVMAWMPLPEAYESELSIPWKTEQLLNRFGVTCKDLPSTGHGKHGVYSEIALNLQKMDAEKWWGDKTELTFDELLEYACHCDHVAGKMESALENADEMIKEIKQKKEEQTATKWIPCSERLPDNDDKVLCCTRTKKGIMNIIIGYYDERWCCGMNSNVVAWMPMPETYEEEE